MIVNHKVTLTGNVKQGGVKVGGSLFTKALGISGKVICDTVVEHIVRDYYDGPFEVTPTQSTQTLSTQDKIVLQNIVVNPIPSNYGLITWDGSKLTVS